MISVAGVLISQILFCLDRRVRFRFAYMESVEKCLRARYKSRDTPCKEGQVLFHREFNNSQKTSYVEGHQILSSLLIHWDFVAAARGADLIYSTLVSFDLTVLHICSIGISCAITSIVKDRADERLAI